MNDFEKLVETMTKAIETFEKVIPEIQKGMLEEVLLLIRKLNLNGDRIRVQAANIRLLDRIKTKLQAIILSQEYVQAVKEYVSGFNEVIKLQNQYFAALERNFKPPRLAKEIRNQAIEAVVNNLAESGIEANITNKVFDLLRQAITSGGSYASLNEQLRDFIINSDSGDGHLLKYTRQITTDAINDFSGLYTQLITSDLNYEWFRYSGVNILTTRPWCLACMKREWFHISEIPKVIKGEFEEFRKYNGKLNKKTGLPNGMKEGTNVTNFLEKRGGHNCGHQWAPVREILVPKDIQQRVYATPEYKSWAQANGRKIEEVRQIE